MLSIFFKLQTLRLELGSAIYFADIQNSELSDFFRKYKRLTIFIFISTKTERKRDEVLV